jgi:hypothetical protein
MLDLNNATGIGLGNLALDQTKSISSLLKNPVTAEGLPSWTAPATSPTFNGLQNGPEYQVPELQGMGDNPTAGMQSSVGTSNSPTSFAPGGPIQASVGPSDFSADRQAVTNAYMSRLQPMLDHERDALNNQLVNQGFEPGTEAYDRAMTQYGQQANDAYNQAVMAGGQEQSRLFGLQLQQGQFGNQAQQQGFGQNQAQGQFAQQGVGQNNQTALSSGSFVNSAASQAFAQRQAQQAFNNAVAQGNAAGANDAANQAYQNAVQQTTYGNSNAQQTFSNLSSNAQLQNQIRQAQLGERENLQSFPINQITALMSGGQVTQPQPVSFNPSSVAPTNVSGNVFNSAALAQQNYQSQLAQQNAAMGGMFGLGSAALMGGLSGGSGGSGNSLIGKGLSALPGLFALSDRRLKRDIVDTGIRLMNGLKLYAFRYLDDVAQNIGLMADEVLAVKPQAVHSVGGYLAVNYDMAMEAA